MALNSNSVCDSCRGRVTNIEGRRKSIEQLTETHNRSCPGRGVKYREGGTDGGTDLDDVPNQDTAEVG